MKPGNVLADDMRGRRPKLRAGGCRIRKTSASKVIRQRIDPDIHHMARVAGHRNAPVEGRTADRKIGQPPFNKRNNFVAVFFRRHEIRSLPVKLSSRS